MGQARDRAGNIWETDEQGNAVRLLQPAAAPEGRVVTLPSNPEKVAATQRQAERDASTDADRAADNARADRALTLQETNAEALNELRQLQVQAAREKANSGRSRETTLNALVRQIDRVQQLYENNVQGFNWNFPAVGMAVPTDANQQFNTAGANLSSLGLAAFRVPGTGTVSDRDAAMFDRANLPSADKYDTSIEEQLLGMRTRVEEEFRALGKPLPNWAGSAQQRAEPEIDPVTGATRDETPEDPGDLPPANMPGGNDPTPPTFGNNSPAPETLAEGTGFLGLTGGTRHVDDPENRRRIASMINAGAGFATINAAMKERGLPPMSFREWDAVQVWMRKTGKPYPASAVNITTEVPLTFGERLRGSEGAAFGAQMANAATAGIPAYLAGEEGERALDAMAAVHPNSSTAGMVTGGITGAVGAEAGLAARAPASLVRYAPRAADALYGATSGFTGAEEGHRLEGAAAGALLAPVAGSAGERLMRGAASTFRGVADPNVRYLYDRGVPLTVGQTVGNSGTVGRFIKGAEDAGTSFPGVGSMIDARRREGIEAFNRAVFQDAAAPGAQVTATGAPGMAQVRQSVTDAYGRALDPVTIDANEDQFINDLAGTIQAAQAIPNVAPANPQNFAMDALRNRIEGAVDPSTNLISGRGFQEAYRGLARSGRERANGDYGFEIGQVTRQGQDVLGEALERQNPGAFDQFLEANAANRRANVLAQALTQAGNQADEMVTPAQLNRADIASTSRLTNKIDSASGNRPFYDLATAGQAVLPSRLPNSGTADRALLGLAMGTAAGGGAGYAAGDTGTGAGLGLGATLALMAGGTKGGQAAMRELLLNRPEVIRAAGEALQRNARLGGGFGAGVLTPLLVGQ